MPRRRGGRKPHEPNIDYFARSATLPGWSCKVCGEPDGRAPVYNLQQAIQHEKSAEHMRAAGQQNGARGTLERNEAAANVQDWKLDLRDRDLRNGMDVGPEIIGFWRKGVEAAGRGEEPEGMEDFLEQLDAAREPWGDWAIDGDWAVDGGNREDAWGQSAVVGGWGGAAPGASSWDDWMATAAQPVTWRKANEVVWRHPHSTSRGSCSQWAGSGNGGAGPLRPRPSPADMRTLVQEYAEDPSIPTSRKDRLQRFSKLSTDEQLAMINENIRLLRDRV